MKFTGFNFILTGSGIYWILSSQLIRSFTVLAPSILTSSNATNALLILGIICTAVGLGRINIDLQEIIQLFSRSDGWIFTFPILLASFDIIVSTIGIASSQAVELNPLISTVIAMGPYVALTFFISYLILAVGLELVMLNLGKTLFGTKTVTQYLGFTTVCGIASFGPFADVLILTIGPMQGIYLLVSACISSMLAASIYIHFKQTGTTTVMPPQFEKLLSF